MGNCCSSEDPLIHQFRIAPTYGEKAEIILKIAARSERMNQKKEAVVHYGTYLHCAAVHIYKEDVRKSRDLTLNKCNSARRIMAHRNSLESAIQYRERKYVAPLISPPQQLAPWEWQEFISMCKSSQCLDALLERFGLVRMASKHSKDMALAAAMATSVTVNPNINVTGPTINNSSTSNPTIHLINGAAASVAPVQPTMPVPPAVPLATGVPVKQ